jgi:hypothetical protein
MTGLLRQCIATAGVLGTLVAPVLASANDWENEGGSHRIKHVFVITLENENYDATFGATSKAPYLAHSLTSQGALLTQYYGTGHVSLDNYIAMISGQAGSLATRSDCVTYADFNLTGVTPDGQAIGTGCVYPANIRTLPDQLNSIGKTWRAYMGDMGNDPTRESATCGHPQLNTTDHTQIAQAPSAAVPLGDQYASRHNPFVYFHSIIDSPDCKSGVVNLNQLSQDLKSEGTTPNFVFVTPNLCDDGHDAPCVNGQPGGLISADAFLQKWIPMIMSSPAYKEDGLIVINFDEGGPTTTATSGGYLITFPGQYCCSEQPGPNLGTFPQTTVIALSPSVSYTITYADYGGDRTGAVLLSPFIKPGTISYTPFNHYSLLKTLEQIFQTDGYLGYAAQPGLLGFFGCVSSDIKTHTGDQFSNCEER